jgi:drug/metabolite transporter (DMT)-like permease
VVLSFLAIYIIWGSTYLVNFIAMEDIPPFLLSGMRFLLAGFIMAVIGFVKKDVISRGTKSIYIIRYKLDSIKHR